VNVFVSRADPATGASDPSPPIKIGKAPITFLLPPGVYRIEVEGIEVSQGSLLVTMQGDPKHLMVRTGSDGLGSTGTLFIAVGITAILGATGILLSGGKAPSGWNKSKVLIPMYAAGGVLLAAGVAMSLVASTNIDDETEKPRPPSGSARGLFLRTSF
jgi:hypothetical protein